MTTKSRIASDITQFKKVLNKYGFTKINTKDWLQSDTIAYEHKKHGWYAEILERSNWADLFIVGHGLRSSGFPGGWVYGSTLELEDDIKNALK